MAPYFTIDFQWTEKKALEVLTKVEELDPTPELEAEQNESIYEPQASPIVH